MNRREMLAGLLSLPFVPKFLRPKKKEFVLRQNHWETGCDPCRAQVAAVTETGTIALTVTDRTKLQTTAKCTTPCTITQVVFHVEDMLVSMLPEGSRIEVRKGDTLVIIITHHHYHTEPNQPCEPHASFMLGSDRQIIEEITSNQKRPGGLPAKNKEHIKLRWDEKNNILQYHNLSASLGGSRQGRHRTPTTIPTLRLWYLAGLHHWRFLHNRKPLRLSLDTPLPDGHHRHLGLQQFLEKKHSDLGRDRGQARFRFVGEILGKP